MEEKKLRKEIHSIEKKFGEDPEFALAQIISTLKLLQKEEIDEYETLDDITRIISNYKSDWRDDNLE